jgi:hypothetical protein
MIAVNPPSANSMSTSSIAVTPAFVVPYRLVACEARAATLVVVVTVMPSIVKVEGPRVVSPVLASQLRRAR